MTDKEFKELLENLPGSYYDFVHGMLDACETDEQRIMVAEFIKNNPGVNDVDVINFYDDNIRTGR